MKKRGIGVASSFQGVNLHFGHDDVSKVVLEVTDEDEFVIRTAASDIGQGLQATLVTILADAFGGVQPGPVRWTGSHSDEPDGGPTGASRQTTLTGNALWLACDELLSRLREVAADVYGGPSDRFHFQGATVEIDDERVLDLAKVLEAARDQGVELRSSGRYVAPPTTEIDELGRGYGINQFGYATHVAVVDVDTETGAVHVVRVRAYHDAGRIVNEIGAVGQVEGGIVMGLGFALTEKYVIEEGVPQQSGFTDYLIPTIRDSPEVDVTFVSEGETFGPLGVKGLAEIPVATIAPAICNAIYDAVGARIYSLPATRERVLAALESVEP